MTRRGVDDVARGVGPQDFFVFGMIASALCSIDVVPGLVVAPPGVASYPYLPLALVPGSPRDEGSR